ncbi:MAG: glycosyltransferase [Blastocatellia bacterium]|nr:glycosyltransferase [Blastocatellia bacterium]
MPTPLSVERVFEQVGASLTAFGHRCSYSKVPWGRGAVKVFLNLLTARFERADIYHITGDVQYMALRLPPERTILTIHDTGILKKRWGLRRAVIKKLYYDLPVRRMRYITVISEATKRELVELTGCDPQKVLVIENPLREIFIASSKRTFREKPVILQVGTGSNKNLKNVIQAVNGLQCKLRIIGLLTSEHTRLLTLSNTEYSSASELSEEEMRAEYEDADIIAFCSTYEGFGLPIIEGQGMLTPVITSDLSPMKEVAGSGAALADPRDPMSIRRAIEKVAGDSPYRQELVKKGTENIRRFSAELIARQYEELYERVIKENEGLNDRS